MDDPFDLSTVYQEYVVKKCIAQEMAGKDVDGDGWINPNELNATENSAAPTETPDDTNETSENPMNPITMNIQLSDIVSIAGELAKVDDEFPDLYSQVLEDAKLDPRQVRELTISHLVEHLKLPLGHAMKIASHFRRADRRDFG